MTSQSPLKILLLSVSLIGCSLVAFWMGWRASEARKITMEYLSQGKFDQIEAMLLMYHEEHGTFPPAKYQRQAGGPAHSWRVLLVPYTSPRFGAHFSNYDFSREWDSTNNLQTLGHMPHFPYFSLDGDGDTTHYLAVSDGEAWPFKKALRSRLITKGTDRFLLVENPESDVHWMEPKF
jgi:hypothetical protein